MLTIIWTSVESFCTSDIKDHWLQIIVTNITTCEKAWNIARITTMWHADMKWANAIGRMIMMSCLALSYQKTSIYFFIFNQNKKKKTNKKPIVSMKHNKAAQ